RLAAESANGIFGGDAERRAHEHLEEARRCRARMSPEMRAMADALAQRFGDPPDERGFIARAVEASDAFPASADLGWVAGFALARTDPARAVGFLDRALAAEPRYMHAYLIKAAALDAAARGRGG